MAFKLKHQNGSPFHQQQESNRLSDEEFNKQFNEGQIFQGGQDIDLGSTERNVSKGAGFPTGASRETMQKWYDNNPQQGDTLSAAKDDAFESDGFFRQAGTLLSNPLQGIKALGNQMSYNYVTDEFGTYDRDPAFNNLTNLRKNKEHRKFGTMQGDEMNAATQLAAFVAGGGVKGLVKGGSKLLSGGKNLISGGSKVLSGAKASNILGDVTKFGKSLSTLANPTNAMGAASKFANSLKNPLTAGTFANAASGDLTALAAKYLPELIKKGSNAQEIAKSAYYGYKGGKIGGVKDLLKAGTKGAIDLSKAVANSVTPEVSKTGLVNAYAQMGKGMQEKATKEKALDGAKEETAIAETNKDNLIMRGS